jgi:hypothetical protein
VKLLTCRAAGAVRASVCALTLCLLAGCRGQAAPEPQEKQALRKLAVLYGRYQGAHKGTPPRDLDELKAFTRKLDKEQLDNLHVEPGELDKLFTSTRDNKPFALRGNVKAAPGDPTAGPAAPVIAYEQEGSGGKRWVAFGNTDVQELDARRFKELVPEAP